MKRSFWITLAVSVTVCAAALSMQSMKNRSLAEKLASQNAVTGSPENRNPDVGTSVVSSDERIERIRSEIETMIRDSPDGSMVDILRKVEGLSLDELGQDAEAVRPPCGRKRENARFIRGCRLPSAFQVAVSPVDWIATVPAGWPPRFSSGGGAGGRERRGYRGGRRRARGWP